jgi:hypothetical protein
MALVRARLKNTCAERCALPLTVAGPAELLTKWMLDRREARHADCHR